MSKKRAERIYKNDVMSRNPWKEPTSSTKKPAPTVPMMAANVPAVFDNPVIRHEFSKLDTAHCLMVLIGLWK